MTDNKPIMIENVKKIKEMELCYKANLKLCKKQEKQINKLATCIEEIKEIIEIHKDDRCAICPKFDECFEQPSCDTIILQKIEEIMRYKI